MLFAARKSVSADCLYYVRLEQASACRTAYGPLIRAAFPLRRPAMVNGRGLSMVTEMNFLNRNRNALKQRPSALVHKTKVNVEHKGDDKESL